MQSKAFLELINNAENYNIKLYPKAYTTWACKPREGTKVLNSHTETIETVTKDKEFVLIDFVGSMSVVSRSYLYSCYTFNKPSLSETFSDLKKENYGNTLDWFKVKRDTTAFVSQGFVYALFIPINHPFSLTNSGRTEWGNTNSLRHGLGDFILCGVYKGKPDMQRWVENGVNVANGYYTRNGKGYIDKEVIGSISKPQSLSIGFVKDREKMQDFLNLTPTQFLRGYKSLTVDEYAETLLTVVEELAKRSEKSESAIQAGIQQMGFSEYIGHCKDLQIVYMKRFLHKDTK